MSAGDDWDDCLVLDFSKDDSKQTEYSIKHNQLSRQQKVCFHIYFCIFLKMILQTEHSIKGIISCHDYFVFLSATDVNIKTGYQTYYKHKFVSLKH